MLTAQPRLRVAVLSGDERVPRIRTTERVGFGEQIQKIAVVKGVENLVSRELFDGSECVSWCGLSSVPMWLAWRRVPCATARFLIVAYVWTAKICELVYVALAARSESNAGTACLRASRSIRRICFRVNLRDFADGAVPVVSRISTSHPQAN